MIKTLRVKVSNWWRKFRKLDCPNCKTALGEFGYCSPCNRFPHRKWITDAEDDFISEERWRRDDPEGYEAWDRECRRESVYLHLKHREKPLARKHLVTIYGEDLVLDAEKRLKSEKI